MTSKNRRRLVPTIMRIALLGFAAALLLGCPGSDQLETTEDDRTAIGGFRAVVDPDTGELTSDPTVSPVSSSGLVLREDSLNTSDAGLFEEELPDGTVMLDPQGRYRSALRVHIVDETEASTGRGEK